MTEKELIEEAAKAMANGEHNVLGWRGHSADEQEWYRKDAAIALAVFEKAHTPHTPTDDEREALARSIHAAHARRWCLNGDGEACPEARQIADALLPGFRRSEVLEPSGPWDLPTSCFGHCDKEGWYGECVSKKADAEVEPQGEPSDAMVKAACEEYAAISFHRRVPQAYMRSALRAALRAASEVGGEGR